MDKQKDVEIIFSMFFYTSTGLRSTFYDAGNCYGFTIMHGKMNKHNVQ